MQLETGVFERRVEEKKQTKGQHRRWCDVGPTLCGMYKKKRSVFSILGGVESCLVLFLRPKLQLKKIRNEHKVFDKQDVGKTAAADVQ